MFRLMKYLKKYWFFLLLAPLAIWIDVSCELSLPKIMSEMIDIGVAEKDGAFLWNRSLFMLALIGVEIVAALCSSFSASYISQSAASDIRTELYHKIGKFSFPELDQYNSSTLLTRLTNDVNQIQSTWQIMLRMMLRAPFTAVLGIKMAYEIHPKLTYIILLGMPLIFILVGVLMKTGFSLFRIVQKKIDHLNRIILENLSGVRVVKAFVLEESQNDKFIEANTELKTITMKAVNIILIALPGMMLIINLMAASVLWFGGQEYMNQTIELGQLTAIITYVMQILFSFLMLAVSFALFSRAKVSADRINEIFDTEITIKDNDEGTATIKEGKIEFKNVSFMLGDDSENCILNSINLLIHPKETLGIIGETGSGKSTLIYLLLRLYEVSEGEILIDDTNINNYSFASLRKDIALVLQESIILSGSVTSNLMFGNENRTKEEMEFAVHSAQAKEFIDGLSLGYDYLLEQRGVNLSGGQKQRISIARALLKGAKILILDDASSALDAKTEKNLMEALKDEAFDCTKIIISQKVNSIKHCDQIAVLSNGKIDAIGTHESLLLTSTIYKEIYESQMKVGEIL